MRQIRKLFTLQDLLLSTYNFAQTFLLNKSNKTLIKLINYLIYQKALLIKLSV